MNTDEYLWCRIAKYWMAVLQLYPVLDGSRTDAEGPKTIPYPVARPKEAQRVASCFNAICDRLIAWISIGDIFGQILPSFVNLLQVACNGHYRMFHLVVLLSCVRFSCVCPLLTETFRKMLFASHWTLDSEYVCLPHHSLSLPNV